MPPGGNAGSGTSLPSSSSIPNGGKLFAGRLRGDAGLS
jgi:hypothetical protein